LARPALITGTITRSFGMVKATPAEQMRRMMDELQSIEAGTTRLDKGPLRKAGMAAVAAAGLMGAPGQAAAPPRQGTAVNYADIPQMAGGFAGSERMEAIARPSRRSAADAVPCSAHSASRSTVSWLTRGSSPMRDQAAPRIQRPPALLKGRPDPTLAGLLHSRPKAYSAASSG